MKRYLLFLLFALTGAVGAMAQSSMTDDQIMKFVMKEQQNGSSQAQIVKKLMQRGVTVQDIRRVRKKYQRLSEQEGLGVVSNQTGGQTDDRTRTNQAKGKTYRQLDGDNLEDREATYANYSVGRLQQSRDVRRRHTYDENDEDFVQMQDEMNQFVPVDTTVLYEQLLEQVRSKKKQVFGRDIFNNEDLTFEPAMNIATPASYVLGAGDAVYIDIYGASQKTIESTVSPDGTVTVEGYGPVTVGGMTVAEANAALRSRLGQRYRNSSIRLTVGQTRTITVNVMGEVLVPGTYTLSSLSTVFNALYMAGGLNDIGTLRNIKVFRGGRLISTCDIYGFIIDGDMSGNVRLMDNDVISVGPYDCLVNMTGKVKRPMYYEMKKGESLATALDYAGGFTGDAYKGSVRVVRKSGEMRSVYNVEEFDFSTFRMMDEDSVTVDSVIDRYENMVEVKGAVFRPGMYQVGGAISSVRSLIEAASGLTEDAFTAHAVMHRMKSDRSLEALSVDVEGIMNGSSPDIPLRSNDVLFIPTKAEMMQQQTLTIHGEVQYPGVYRYASNETLEDFILQAGGLTDQASMVKVDVARRVSDPMAVTTDSVIARTFSFALKDGFVISGGSNFTLLPFDEVYVRKSPGTYTLQNVEVQGQVMFPGSYTLAMKNQRLSDIVKNAGGVNDRAYLAGAHLIRRYTSEERQRAVEARQRALEELRTNLQALAAKSGNANLASMSTMDQLSKYEVGDTYPVGIQLDKAMSDPGGIEDIVLREGDRLVVPEYNGTVKVNGEVMYPNTMTYMSGKRASYYINQAGGYSTKALKGHAYIIYMNGQVAKAGRKNRPQPGCEIVVPQKALSTTTTAERLSMATSVGSFAAIVATIANVLK